MSLAWIVEECSTPFGPIRTYNWGVPDEDEDDTKRNNNASTNAKKYDRYNTDTVGFGNDNYDGDEGGGGIGADELALEPAQDQLGSVLWNSNTVALEHFCRFVRAQEAYDALAKEQKEKAKKTAQQRKNKKHRGEGDGNVDKKEEEEEGAGGEEESEFLGEHEATLHRLRSRYSKNKPLRESELAAAKEILSSKTVLELGSGVGVLGIALSLYGGAKAAITDIKELVPLMEKNIKESAKKVIALPPSEVSCPSSAATAANNNNNNNSNKGKQNNNKKGGGHGQQPNTSSSHHNSSAFATTIEGRGAKGLPPQERGGCCRAYSFRWGEPLPKNLHSFLGSRTNYIVMCDALYGNPTEWPKLIQNLREIVEIAKKSIADDINNSDDNDDSSDDDGENNKKNTKKKRQVATAEDDADEEEGDIGEENTDPFACRQSRKLPIIVNYCEQRVDKVEKAFMALLKKTIPEWVIVGPTTLQGQSGMGMEVRATAIYTR